MCDPAVRTRVHLEHGHGPHGPYSRRTGATLNDNRPSNLRLGFLLALLLCAASCAAFRERRVERQYHDFDTVKEKAQELEKGMTRTQVLLLLGSPADKSIDDKVWLYFPESLSLFTTERALRLVFKGGYLDHHEFRTIVLGDA